MLTILQTDLSAIAELALAKEAENDAFKDFLKAENGAAIDIMVHELNDIISPKIDCTTCGNCCKSLMINVTGEELQNLATHLEIDPEQLKEKYIEESLQGKMIMNKIPCHFLSDTKCSIYEYRFSGCREFPHLDRPQFTDRLFGTLMYYDMCPIIFNVVEELKIKTGFHS